MNLELTKTEIIVYALSLAFIFKTIITPLCKQAAVKFYKWINKKKTNLNDVAKINSNISEFMQWEMKPASCIKCMTFWLTIILGIIYSNHEDVGLLAVVGLACGMLLEGILMRYF